jgi:hypothetical protein
MDIFGVWIFSVFGFRLVFAWFSPGFRLVFAKKPGVVSIVS